MTELVNYFKFKCEKGMSWRGLSSSTEHAERLEYEQSVILGMNYPGYFMICQHLLDWCRKKGIYVGPGRGSAAGSLVSYSLGITNLDPIEHDLLFERFLNPSRISMPDIDMDIEDRYRHLVIEYARQRFGYDKVAHIGTFGTLKARSAIKTAGSVLGILPAKSQALADLTMDPIHGKPQKLKVSIQGVPELLSYHNNQKTIEGQVLETALQMEGLVKSIGVHAAGVVIANEPLIDKVPMVVNKEGLLTTQWEMDTIEEAGFIKFDFLGLDALSKLHCCVDIVKERHGVEIDIDHIPQDDEKTFAMLRSGSNIGVFQLETSAGMRDLLVQIRPTSIADLTALVAIFRPGPLCLSGDTVILTGVSRGKHRQNFKTTTLEELYRVYKNKSETDKNHHPRSLQSTNLEKLELITNRIVDVCESGEKDVYRLTIQIGLTSSQRKYVPSGNQPQRRTNQIKSSLEHKFLTLTGWKPLKEITSGEYVAIAYSRGFGSERKRSKDSVYGKKNFKNIAFRHYQYRCVFCDWNEGALDVNHLEGNRETNNSPDNLSFLCPNHHRMYIEGSISEEELRKTREPFRLPISRDVMFVRFLGKEFAGREQTYDISMTSPLNNFVAGDFIVHNSSSYKDVYLEIRAERRDPEYLTPELAPILSQTSGWMIYQEQAMQIARDLCGYSMAEADNLRKAIGKKKRNLMNLEEGRFKQGWIKNGYPADKVEILWKELVAHAEYSFNKSHAAAYALVTYQTAYLKAHYPHEFMCAVMQVKAGDKDQMIKYLAECKTLGVKILPPDINSSRESFYLDDDDNIRFGFGPIKNLGAGHTTILKERVHGPFTDFRNFYERVDTGVLNKTKLETLIMTGTFDRFDHNRATLLHHLIDVLAWKKLRKSYELKLITFEKRTLEWEQREEEVAEGKRNEKGVKLKSKKLPVRPKHPVWPEVLDVDELDKSEREASEFDLLGMFISSHPLDGLDDNPLGQTLLTIADIKTVDEFTGAPLYVNKSKVDLAVVVTAKKVITTSTKKQQMATLQMEDLTGSIGGVVFPHTYQKVKEDLEHTIPLRVSGEVEVTQTEEGMTIFKLKVYKTSPLRLQRNSPQETIDAHVPLEQAGELAQVLGRLAGDKHKVRMFFTLGDGTEIHVPAELKIGSFKLALLKQLERINHCHKEIT